MTKLLENLAIAMLLSIFAMVAWNYPDLPAQIPSRFNIPGNTSGTVTKGVLWIFPFIATNLFLLLSAAAFVNQKPEHADARQTAAMVKVGVMALLAWLAWRQVSA